MNSLVILGNFDGVHLGHQNLIKKAVKYGRENNLKIVVYTFRTLSKNKELITTLIQREKALLNLGIDEVVYEEFEKVRKYGPEEFVNKILKEELNTKIVFCGYNYKFGYMRKGNTEVLKKLIDTVVIDEFKIDDEIVSSTRIRELLNKGEIVKANRLIGRNFEFDGIVIKGRQIGRVLGFPTANIEINEKQVTLPNGVYGSSTIIEGYDKEFLSITNVGQNPTISDHNKQNVETHILDFNDDIYGKKIKVKLINMIRPEVKFNSLDELKGQIQKDCNMWRKENVRHKNK